MDRILSEIAQIGNLVGNGTHGCNHTNMYHNKCNQCLVLCTSNIFQNKIKNFKWNCFYIMLFSMYWYIILKFEIILMNDKYPKSTLKTL